jgi:hypothetical protein
MANTFINKKVDLTSTDATTLYTVPSATTAVIKSILVSDDSGSGSTITITLTDTDSAVFSLFNVKSISASGTSELLSAPLVVAESEVIKVTAAAANRLHVVLSALEIKPRVVTS